MKRLVQTQQYQKINHQFKASVISGVSKNPRIQSSQSTIPKSMKNMKKPKNVLNPQNIQNLKQNMEKIIKMNKLKQMQSNKYENEVQEAQQHHKSEKKELKALIQEIKDKELQRTQVKRIVYAIDTACEDYPQQISEYNEIIKEVLTNIVKQNKSLLLKDFAQLVQQCDKFQLKDTELWLVLGMNFTKLITQREYNEISDISSCEKVILYLVKTFNIIQKQLKAFGSKTAFLEDINLECYQQIIKKAGNEQQKAAIIYTIGTKMENNELCQRILNGSLSQLDKELKRLNINNLVQIAYLIYKKTLNTSSPFIIKLIKNFIKSVERSDSHRHSVFSFAISNLSKQYDTNIYKDYIQQYHREGQYLSSAESSDLIMYGIAAKKFGLTLDQHYSSHCENLVSQQLNTLSTKELVELLSLDLVVQQTQSKMLFNIEFIKLMIQTLDQLVLSQWKQKNDKEKKEIEEMFTSYQKICQLQSLKSYNIIFKQITQQTNNADTKSSTKVQNNQQ